MVFNGQMNSILDNNRQYSEDYTNLDIMESKAEDWIEFNRTISSIESATLPNISSYGKLSVN